MEGDQRFRPSMLDTSGVRSTMIMLYIREGDIESKLYIMIGGNPTLLGKQH